MTNELPNETPDALPLGFETENVLLASLHAHPRNYQVHPDDELEHLKASILEHGFYRNIVVTQDGTILAGHGVVEAARRLGYEKVPAVRVPYDANDPRAIKLLIGDNEIRHLAEVDDRALTELLRELNESEDLLGTGYDEMMVANLAMVTRPTSEMEDFDAAAAWVGMPDYEIGARKLQLLVNFANEQDRNDFYRFIGIQQDQVIKRGATKSVWWPRPLVKDDSINLTFIDGDDLDDALGDED